MRRLLARRSEVWVGSVRHIWTKLSCDRSARRRSSRRSGSRCCISTGYRSAGFPPRRSRRRFIAAPPSQSSIPTVHSIHTLLTHPCYPGIGSNAFTGGVYDSSLFRIRDFQRTHLVENSWESRLRTQAERRSRRHAAAAGLVLHKFSGGNTSWQLDVPPRRLPGRWGSDSRFVIASHRNLAISVGQRRHADLRRRPDFSAEVQRMVATGVERDRGH